MAMIPTWSMTDCDLGIGVRMRDVLATVVLRTDKPQKSVNELLANLRRIAIGPSAASSQPAVSATTPSVPPAIREILQLPETPAPAPRRPVRQRFDGQGRRLPAGPPPPRSWVARRLVEGRAPNGSSSRSTRLSPLGLAEAILPGTYLPARGSLIDIVLHKLACDWEFHRVYNQYHLYFVPDHLKPALIRFIGIASEEGLSLNDLRTILLPPPDTFDDGDEVESLTSSNTEVTYLDLSGCIGRSMKLKDVSELLFPAREQSDTVEPQDTWDTAESIPSPPRALVPNLTHLSLALDPRYASFVSWKQLLAFSPKLSTVTHLSLAFWPDPCLTPGARRSSVVTPQGNIPYGGTNIYSHSIDHDWSEALLVLRMLSKNLYALEFLDLTGCAPWFKALMAESEHDHVDWVGNWGKITELRLFTGWRPGEHAPPSDQSSYLEAVEMARNVERHIRATRAGQGRFIIVERDKLET
ncbi:Fc.00g090340.m01.CDS01 [Cosmosporella sp. VM-42]